MTGEPRQRDSELADRFIRDALPHLDQLYRGARRMTPTRYDAEDLVQQTMERAYNSFRSFRDGTNLRAWLFRIMYNAWVDDYRARQRRPLELLSADLSDWELATHAARAPIGLRSAEVEALEAMGDDEIAAALDELPMEHRMAVYFADVEGMRYREIATLMDVPIGTVMSRLHRARRRLRQLLADVANRRGVRAALPAPTGDG